MRGREQGAARLNRIPLVLGVCALGSSCISDPPRIERYQDMLSVEDFEAMGCSTGVVRQLSLQIAKEVDCLMPGALSPFEEGGNIAFSSSAVLPFLEAEARDGLLAAAAASDRVIAINSAYRTMAQQYLLRRWYEQGMCGITAAAQPGRSNHESGRAIDISDYQALQPVLEAQGWAQTVPGDPVHFDFLAAPDNRGLDVLGFQRLWNRNTPEDLLTEDGIYGAETAARLRQAPAEGFPISGCTDAFGAEVLAIDSPTTMSPDELAAVSIEVINTGEESWSAQTLRLESSSAESVFYDALSWEGPGIPAVLQAAAAPGETIRFEFSIVAPGQDGRISEGFHLYDEEAGSFGPDIPIAVTVESEGGGEGEEALGDVYGGCSTSGAGGSAWPGLLLLLAWRSRKRVDARFPST